MAQSLAADFPIDPTTTSGDALADILNRQNSAFNTTNAGPTPPPRSYPGQMWLDTSVGASPNGVLRLRDSTNQNWSALLDSANPAATSSDVAALGGRVSAVEGSITAIQNDKVNRAGDTMTGALALPVLSLASSGSSLLSDPGSVFWRLNGTDWQWVFDRTTGNLNWMRPAGLPWFSLQPNGNVTTNGGALNTAGGILGINDFVMVQTPQDCALRFTGDGWSLVFTRGNGDLTYWDSSSTAWWRFNNKNFLLFVGNGFKPGGGPWADASDERIKDDIQPYMTGLSAIRALRPVSYRFKEQTGRDTTKRYVRLIAQEAMSAMPELVTIGAGKCGQIVLEDMHSLDESPVLWALVNAMNEVAERVEALEGH